MNGDDAAAAAEAVDADASEEVVVGRIEEVMGVASDMLMFNFVAAAEKLVVWLLLDNDDEDKVQNAIMYAVEQRGRYNSGWSMMPFLCL